MLLRRELFSFTVDSTFKRSLMLGKANRKSQTLSGFKTLLDNLSSMSAPLGQCLSKSEFQSFLFPDTNPFEGDKGAPPEVKSKNAYQYLVLPCKDIPESSPPYTISWYKTDPRTQKQTRVIEDARIVTDPQGLCRISFTESICSSI